jgi:hypothetical protein
MRDLIEPTGGVDVSAMLCGREEGGKLSPELFSGLQVRRRRGHLRRRKKGRQVGAGGGG